MRNSLVLHGVPCSASTLSTSAWALCYSVAECCCPMWSRSSYTNLIDTQLHSSMRLISGCLQPTQLLWLPVLSNVAPPSLRCKAATDNMLQITEAPSACACWCLWASTSTACISTPDVVRHDICRHNYSVERGLVVGFCGQPHSTILLLPTQLSDSQVSISLVIHGLWWTVSGQVKALHVVLSFTNGVSPNHLSVIVASDRPWTTLSTRAHLQNLKADWIYSTKRMMTQSYGWNLQRLQHSQNNNKFNLSD